MIENYAFIPANLRRQSVLIRRLCAFVYSSMANRVWYSSCPLGDMSDALTTIKHELERVYATLSYIRRNRNMFTL